MNDKNDKNDKNEKIHQLISKLGTILDQQEQIYIEIKNLRAEIEEVKISNKQEQYSLKSTKEPPVIRPPIEKETEQIEFSIIKKREDSIPLKKKTKPESQWLIKEDLEKFVGENLINKIGIAVTVIGVSIGAKYAIDNNLISPLTRIILGYLVGFSFFGIAVKSKKKYINFSASLLSGAAAILFFITYAAYTFYQLFPLTIAFFLLLIVTVFTVLSAVCLQTNLDFYIESI